MFYERESKKSERQIAWEEYTNKVLSEAGPWGVPDYKLPLAKVEAKYNLPPIDPEDATVGKVRETGQKVLFINSPQNARRFIPEIQLGAVERDLYEETKERIPVVVVTEDIDKSMDINPSGYPLLAALLGKRFLDSRPINMSLKTAQIKALSVGKKQLRYYGIPSKYLKEGSLQTTTNGASYQKSSLLRFFVEPNLHTEESWWMIMESGNPIRIQDSRLGKMLEDIQERISQAVTVPVPVSVNRN